MTVFDPVFTPADAAYFKDYAGYIVLPVRIEENDPRLLTVSNRGAW